MNRLISHQATSQTNTALLLFCVIGAAAVYMSSFHKHFRHHHHKGHKEQRDTQTDQQVVDELNAMNVVGTGIQHPFDVRVVPPRFADTSISSAQLGTLTGNVNGVTSVLPLMGNESLTRRGRWNYYTYTNEYNKQPVSVVVNGKDCMLDRGCDELFNGDTVRAAPYNADFETYLFR